MEGGKLLGGQIAATAITWIVAIALTYVILLLLDATMGLRVTREDEVQGLDFSQHGEEGYIFV
jgi:Amt family ammonium transporter